MKTVLTILALGGLLAVATAASEPVSPEVKAWLAAQGSVQTWSADLMQTRAMQSLIVPLKSKGRVWFESPGRFRWELGQPPQTIAISTLTNLYIIYPRLKRVESISLTGEQAGPWRLALDMLQAGFPRTEKDLLDAYDILSQSVTGQTCRLQMQPRADLVRRVMRRVEIDFDTKDHLLRGTELQFADGSTMRNDFNNIVANPKIPTDIFAPDIPSDYRVVYPQAQH